METRECAGYQIIVAVPIDAHTEVVIGRRSVQPEPYVCWWCTNKNDYNFGRYCMTYRQAMQALAERIRDSYDSIPRDLFPSDL